MRNFFYFLLLFLPAFAFSQPVKTAAVPYTKGSGYTPNIAGSSEIRVDTATSQMYWWNRDALTWVLFRPGIDVITGSIAPAYTPRDNQSLFAVNADGEVYYYNSPSWVQIGGAGGGGIYGGSGTTGAAYTTATIDSIFRFLGDEATDRFIAAIAGGTDVAALTVIDTAAYLYFDDAQGTNQVEANNEGIILTTNTNDRVTITGKDARYAADYSAGFSTRSLVDVGYLNSSLVGAGGIYSGNGTLFAGGANVTFTGANPLRFWTTGATTVPIEQKIVGGGGATAYFDRYLINNDSIQWRYLVGRFTLESIGAALTYEVDGEFRLQADSTEWDITGVATGTGLKYQVGLTTGGTLQKIQGSSDGDILAWDSGSSHWEVRTPASTGDILNGGNTTGAAVTIGTNDAHGLNIETNNVTRVAITGAASTGGAVTISNTTANTNTTQNVVTIQSNSTGTAAAGFGPAILMQGESSTTDNRDMVRLASDWLTETDASRKARFIISTSVNGSITEIARFYGNNSPQMTIGGGSTGYFNSGITAGTTFTVGGSSSTVNIGASSGDVRIGQSTGGVEIARNTATTNAVVPIYIDANTTGTPANGLGPQLLFRGESSTTTSQEMGSVSAVWTDVTHATRTANLVFSTVNNAGSNTERARVTATGLSVTGDLTLNTAGNKINITTGSNASMGTATLVAGTVTVNTTAVTTNSIIFLTCNTPGGTQGFLSAPAASITNGTSFVINSSSGSDTSTVNWWIVN